jgi:hypothetical protein
VRKLRKMIDAPGLVTATGEDWLGGKVPKAIGVLQYVMVI